MFHQGIQGIPYYLGIRSLADIATPEDRVCVLNIMGGESRQVTPTSHAFSGGNVVFGTSPGRSGQALRTPAGDIPVFNNVREGLDAGHTFNTGVVYLPPSGVRDGVAELIRVNSELRKIVIITEKIAVHDAREIRAMAQANGVDIIGGNCLGVADSWNRVRIGGALGGDHPDESLIKGSVAIFSNSGGFTTTIAQYLGTAGWGTTTLVSSGKDLYIHYACPDFARAFAADDRSAAAVLYAEPGGYYEHGLEWTKPVVACVVGRWKSKLTRAVGHAGAMAGSGDRAEDKEHWFMEAFGVSSIFTPGQSGGVEEGRGRHQHRRHPGGADRGYGVERRRAGLRTARQPGAEAMDRQRPGAAAAGGHRAAAGYGARALCGADRDARPAGRCGRRPADDEGQVGRVGHGPEDPGDERARA